MEMLLSFIGGLALAVVVAWIYVRSLHAKNAQEVEKEKDIVRNNMLLEAQSEKSGLSADLENTKRALTESKAEKDQLADRYDKLRSEKESLQAEISRLNESLRQQEVLRDEKEAYAKKQMELLKEQFETVSRTFLTERTSELEKVNADNMGKLINPIWQEMENVRKLMNDTKSSTEKSTASLEGSLKEMVAQTQRIGQEANNLADAMKNRGKVHGDWGEHVLEDILTGSGMREGYEYSRQENYKGGDGNDLRPDVVVKCPDGRCIIVDSKVSLKDYSDALGAGSEEERQLSVKRNFDSMKKHVRELADKQYPKYVEGSLDYVLMFIPNEGAYVMAMNYDPSLGQQAFQQGVIIVNPTNLMLALHLVLQTWQNTRQEENCRNIINVANGLYDKIVGLVDTCNSLGNQLNTANKTYEQMSKQLVEGNGNVMRRLEILRDLGITSNKRVKVKKTKLQSEQMPENALEDATGEDNNDN